MPARFKATFYNLGPAGDRVDPTAGARREIAALLEDDPAVLGLSEAIGYRLPQIPGHTLLRDTSRPGRANIAAYVSDKFALTRVRWHDMVLTWPRTEHAGTHPARSWLEFRAGQVQVLVGHQPPKLPPRSGGAERTWRVQQEGINLLGRRMAPWTSNSLIVGPLRRRAEARPRVVLMDANRTLNEPGPGPKTLAADIGGWVAGDRIDCAVVRGMTPVSVGYVEHINGVTLRSDHKHAFRFVGALA